MARYIDADAVEKRIVDYYDAQLQSYPSSKDNKEKERLLGGINYGRNVVRDAPTADVVPKSENDMLHHLLKDAWKSIEELGNLCGELQKAKDEVAREILSDLKKAVHNKATYTHAKDTYSFINLNTFDQIVNEMIRRCENHGNQEA